VIDFEASMNSLRLLMQGEAENEKKTSGDLFKKRGHSEGLPGIQQSSRPRLSGSKR
jgi:hypothetical protein